MMATTERNDAFSALSLDQARDLLRQLEAERDHWSSVRIAKQAWIDAAEKRLQQLQLPTPATTSSDGDQASVSQAPSRSPTGNNDKKAPQSTSTVQKQKQLQQDTLRLLKMQQEIATVLKKQIRTIREKDEPSKIPTPLAIPPAPVQSQQRSPTQPKHRQAAVKTPPKRGNNVLVLAPVTTTALGKRLINEAERKVEAPTYPSLAGCGEFAGGEKLASMVFRLASREFLSHGKKPSLATVKEKLTAYAGYDYAEVDVEAAMSRAVCLVVDQVSDDMPAVPSPEAASVELADEGRLQAWMEIEKAQLDEFATTWAASSTKGGDARQLRLVTALASLPFGDHKSIDTVLASWLRGEAAKPSQTHTTSAYPHLAAAIEAIKVKFQANLSGDGGSINEQATKSLSGVATTFARPFDLDRDSVTRQLHRTNEPSRKRRRADPMKVLCIFELSGVCNDPNCTYQHQRDFEDESPESDGTEKTEDSLRTEAELVPEATRSTVNQLLQLRDELRNQWPTASQISQSVRTDATEHGAAKSSSPMTRPGRDEVPVADESESDFIALDSDEMMDESDSQLLANRYCVGDSERNSNVKSTVFSTDSLEQHVRSNPEDANAWLLLALRVLDLDVSMSDDQAWVSESTRLHGQLNALRQQLTRTEPAMDRGRVEQCLQTLSRALEIEANAYCEELWMLHLRVSRLLPDQTPEDVQGELEMAEQALNFVPTSIPLWRHFLSQRATTVKTLQSVVETFTLLIQAVASVAQTVKQRQIKEAFSVLLGDMLIHLCVVYCQAGVSKDAISLLRRFLGLDDEAAKTPATDWHAGVRAQLIGDDLLILYVLLVHLILFHEMPRSLSQRGFHASHAANVYQLLLSYDLVLDDRRSSSAALAVCEAAFKQYGVAQHYVPPGIDVLLHNCVLVVSVSADLSQADQLKRLQYLETHEYPKHGVLPRVLTVLAHVYRSTYGRPDLADAAIGRLDSFVEAAAVGSTGSVQSYGEAVHHYLLHHPQQFAVDAFQATTPSLPDIVALLAMVLPASSSQRSQYTRHAVTAIAEEPTVKLRGKAFARLISSLMRDTLAHIVASQANANEDADEQDIVQDTYYVMAQAQLLRQVCGDPHVAIDALDMIVIQGAATSWSGLPVEARRMIWSTRLLLQGDAASLTAADFARLVERFLVDVAGSHGDRLSVVTLADVSGREVPDIRHAIRDRCAIDRAMAEPLGALELQVLSVCTASLSHHELSSHVAATLRTGGHDSRLLVHYADGVLHTELQHRVRAALRRLVYSDAATLDPQAMCALVSIELKLKNVHGLKHLLAHRLRVNPLDCAVWQVMGKLELLFGASLPSRAEDYAAAVAKTSGVIVHLSSPLSTDGSSVDAASMEIALRSSLLTSVPTTLLASCRERLRVLDLSDNLLVALPSTISVLRQLQVLKLSGNSLVALPPSIGQLQSLRVVELAHNNLASLPNAFWDGLLQLRALDLRYNALQGVSPRVVRLTQLELLRVEGNAFEWKGFEAIRAKLPVSTVVDIDPRRAASVNSSRGPEEEEEEESKSESTADEGEAPVNGPHPGTPALSPSTTASLTHSTPRLDTPPPSHEASTPPGSNVETPQSSSPPPLLQAAEAIESDDEVEFLGSTSSSITTSAISVLLRQPRVSPVPSSQSASPETSAETRDEPKNPDRSSVEWRTFVDNNILRHSHYGVCVLCRAPNDTHTHQQFGMVIMCADCIVDAGKILQERAALRK